MKALLFICSLSLPLTGFADIYDHRLIHTNGYGEVKVKPDMAKLSLSANADRPKALDAKSEVDKRVNNFLAALEKQGVKKKDIVASSLRTNPRHEYNRATSKNKFVGYSATRQLTVTVRQLNRLTDIMDLALSHDIQTIGNIHYDSSNADQHRDRARRNAVENSKRKARALAKAYGAELGAIANIQYHNWQAPFGVATQPENDMAMARSQATLAGAQKQNATYLPDQITFSDHIQVTFDLIVQ